MCQTILPHRIGDLEIIVKAVKGGVALPHRIGDLEIPWIITNGSELLPHRIGDLETYPTLRLL